MVFVAFDEENKVPSLLLLLFLFPRTCLKAVERREWNKSFVAAHVFLFCFCFISLSLFFSLSTGFSGKNYVVDALFFLKDLNPLTPKVWYQFGEFSIGSTNNPLIDILLYSRHFYAWYCIDIVRRNSLLVTHGSSFVSLQGAWRMGELVKEIKLVSGVRLRIRINTSVDGHAWKDQFLSTARQFPVRWEFASSPARRDSLFNRHWVTSHTLFKTRSPENSLWAKYTCCSAFRCIHSHRTQQAFTSNTCQIVSSKFRGEMSWSVTF